MADANRQDPAERAIEDPSGGAPVNRHPEVIRDGTPPPATDPGGSQTEYVYIGEDTAVAVEVQTGKIVGANAEGTLGIVIYGGDPKDRAGDLFRSEKAIRIPRLLQSELLLNFHVAEIAYHEGRQARHFRADIGVVGADSFYRFDKANTFTTIPGFPGSPCFVGFYLSPISHYQLCLVSKDKVWPAHFSDYLTGTGKSAKDLYEKLSSLCESADAEIFNRLLFVPHRKVHGGGEAANVSFPEVVSRENISLAYEKKEVGGWWFNVPVASYPWMTANLERLLTGYIDDDFQDKPRSDGGASLRGWKLDAWFQLLKHLVLGFNSLHNEGAIHGDPRPANIMTHIRGNADLRPEGFRWIDIGLGYSTNGVPLEEQTSITPRPLGGGRTTPFYAPERVEAIEFEDADVVLLERIPSQEHLSKLTFFWKERTYLQPTVLPLMEGGTPIRELGKLSKGDRVQVREFLFEVERVEPDGISVSHIYEIFLERVLIERRGGDRETIYERFKNAPISRYRIFQKWSQATDIYGLGIVALYLFFVRGLSVAKKASTAKKDPAGPASGRNRAYDRSKRERIFGDLSTLLRNQSFLESLFQNLKRNGFENRDSLWQQDVQIPGSEPATKIKEVSEVIYATDSNFEFIWHGLNRNHGLFIQLIYFCLCCVWRKDEVKEIVERTKFDFRPFCDSRLVTGTKEQTDLPSKMALGQLEELIRLINNASVRENEEITDSHTFEILGRSREEQMLTLRDELQKANLDKKELKKSLTESKAEVKSKGELLGRIYDALKNTSQQLDAHKALLGGVDRKFVDESLEELRRMTAVAWHGEESDLPQAPNNGPNGQPK